MSNIIGQDIIESVEYSILNKKRRRKTLFTYDLKQFKIISGELLLILALIISLINTLATVYIISKYPLIDPFGIISLNLNTKGDEELLLHQNIVTDTLIPQEKMLFNEISAKEIIIHSGKEQKGLPDIQVRQDAIELQAKSFSVGETEEELSFVLPPRLNILDVPAGISNIRSIRALNKFSVANSVRFLQDDLSIISDKDLELSGNMGLRIHSSHKLIKSPKEVTIESREGSISIDAGKGIHLTKIHHEHDESILDKVKNLTDQLIEDNTITQPSKAHLWIDRSDGQVFKTYV